jgi:integrase/recombinase XerD
MSKPQITLAFDEHRNSEVVSLCFEKDFELISKVKSIPGAAWSQSRKFWYINKADFQLNQVFEKLKPVAYLDYSALKQQAGVSVKKEEPKAKIEKEPVKIPQGYTNLLVQKRYAQNTKSIYLSYFADFIRHFNNRNLEEITKQEINDYILGLIETRNISPSQQNQRINAIKFYYEKVLGRQSEYYDIERPLAEKRLPDVLSKEEIGEMIKTVKFIKHRFLIALTYSCGLRRSEVVDLKITAIDTKRMQVFVKGAKGKKDRYVPLAKNTLRLLEKYLEKDKPVIYLFEGNEGKQYSKTSVYNVVKNTAKKAGIRKRVYPHILRHSGVYPAFCGATHNLEQGMDLRLIQELLGHESSKTTEIYTHVSQKDFAKFKNPFDDDFFDTS